LQFLGHEISAEGIHTDPEKCRAIQNWGKPTKAKDIRSFLGAAGYYRRFIPGFSGPASKLTPLLKKNAKFQWTKEHEEALNDLKTLFTTPPVLIPPEFGKPFIVLTDASNYAISGALMQLKDAKEHPIRYWSRTLQPAERNYSTTDKEALAVVESFKQFRVYLLGTKVHLFTDHHALKQVLVDPEPTGRRARWVAALIEYDFEIRHRPGSKNLLADSLSRDPALRAVFIDMTQDPDADDLLVDVKKYLQGDGTLISLPLGRSRKIMKLAVKMTIKNGELYKRRMNGNSVRVIISRKRRQQLLAEVHDGLAHFGEKATYDLVANAAWWPNIQQDAINYVKTCKTCQTYSRTQKPDAPIRIPVDRLFERIALDYIGPLPATDNGNKYILVAVDALTRWPLAKAVPDADAKATAQFIYDEIVLQYGPPETILTDQGTHFINKLVKQVTKLLEVRHLRTTPYHPQTNGMTERFNGTLCTALAKLASHHQEDWDQFIPVVLYAYRIRKHTDMKHSPYEAMYGQSARLPNGILLGAEYFDDVTRKQTTDKIRDEAKRPPATKRSKFHLGQTVLWKAGIRRNKLEPKLEGPFTITSIGPNNTYLLSDDKEENPILISGDRLKAYVPRQSAVGRRAVVPVRVTQPTSASKMALPPDKGYSNNRGI
jgi:hypothetical protein